MKKITVTAPAKINLCIDVLKKDASGYHQIQTVLCVCENYQDEITIFETKESDKVSIVNADKNQPIKMEENLVFKAIKLLKSTLNFFLNPQIFKNRFT